VRVAEIGYRRLARFPPVLVLEVPAIADQKKRGCTPPAEMAEIEKPHLNPCRCRGYFCRAARGQKSTERTKTASTSTAAGTTAGWRVCSP